MALKNQWTHMLSGPSDCCEPSDRGGAHGSNA